MSNQQIYEGGKGGRKKKKKETRNGGGTGKESHFFAVFYLHFQQNFI